MRVNTYRCTYTAPLTEIVCAYSSANCTTWTALMVKYDESGDMAIARPPHFRTDRTVHGPAVPGLQVSPHGYFLRPPLRLLPVPAQCSHFHPRLPPQSLAYLPQQFPHSRSALGDSERHVSAGAGLRGDEWIGLGRSFQCARKLGR